MTDTTDIFTFVDPRRKAARKRRRRAYDAQYRDAVDAKLAQIRAVMTAPRKQ